MPRATAHKTTQLIEASIEILREIQPATVRGVCYKLFARGFIPDMSKNSTNRVGRVLVRAREEGTIPWNWIVDEHRSIDGWRSWEDPEAFVEETMESYKRDYWQDQPYRLILTSEKGTVRGVLNPILRSYALDFLALHGYSSATVLHNLAMSSQIEKREFVLLYVGDFDPSGRHMSDVDLPGRIERYGGRVTISRIALVESDREPLRDFSFSAETKSKDARYRWYVDHYGDQCNELDALDPNELRSRVERELHEWMDLAAWEQSRKTEAAERRSIHEVVSGWRNLLSGQPQNNIGGAS